MESGELTNTLKTFLRFDEMNTLDPKKNPAFEFCEAQYFLAVDLTACAASLSVSIHVPSPSFGIFTEFERV